jgi:hypothetical protein
MACVCGRETRVCVKTAHLQANRERECLFERGQQADRGCDWDMH